MSTRDVPAMLDPEYQDVVAGNSVVAAGMLDPFLLGLRGRQPAVAQVGEQACNPLDVLLDRVLSMGFGFSGYLLPWNQLAFFATKVGTDITGVVPVVGPFMLRFLRGGDQITGGTLTRFFGFHVALLPAITTAILGVHLYLVMKHGMSIPPGVERSTLISSN